MRLESKACESARMHARLCKFFNGSGYYVLQQLIGKAQIPISKIQIQVQEWKAAIITLLMCSYCVGERLSQQVVLSYGFYISAKITSFCLFRTKFEMRLESGCVAEGRKE